MYDDKPDASNNFDHMEFIRQLRIKEVMHGDMNHIIMKDKIEDLKNLMAEDDREIAHVQK
jgi:hypothetical protein